MRQNPDKKRASAPKPARRPPEPKERRPAAAPGGPAEEDPRDREERAREGRTAESGTRENKGGQGGAPPGGPEFEGSGGERDRDQAPIEEKGPLGPLPQGRRPREGRRGPSR